MSLPFIEHRKKIVAALPGSVNQCNLALLLYRYLHPKNESQQQTLAAEFVLAANKVSKASAQILCAIQERQSEQLKVLASNGYKSGGFQATISWRLLIGASVGRVWDIGLQLHPLYGLPFLPASAIKGMFAHYAEEENIHSVIFLDAFCLPTTQDTFEEDIINTHYPQYYRDGISPPADYCDPVPVKFVAIAGGVTFRFRYAVQGGHELKPLLQGALETFGIGAKTRVGYGRFSKFVYAE